MPTKPAKKPARKPSDRKRALAGDKNLAGANLERANLYGAILQDVNLAGANLAGANLERANLRYANLKSANLKGANLVSATLVSANLEGANLTGTNLYGADLEGVDLEGANLTGANLTYANLYETNLTGANLSGANLEGAYLEGANLTGANLAGAILQYAGLQSANLKDADLRYANLERANLQRAKLYSANLEGADLVNANLYETNLTGANLTGANLTGAYLEDADLRRANLTGTNLYNVTLIRANLEDANLEDANLKDADLTDANLRDANLTGANLTGANLEGAKLEGTILEKPPVTRPVRSFGRQTGAVLKMGKPDAPARAAEFKKRYPSEFERLKADTQGRDFSEPLRAQVRKKYETPFTWLVTRGVYTDETQRLCPDPNLVYKFNLDLDQPSFTDRQRAFLKKLAETSRQSEHPHEKKNLFTVGWVRLCVNDDEETWLVEEIQSDVGIVRTKLKDGSAPAGLEGYEDVIVELRPYIDRFYEDALGIVFMEAEKKGYGVEMLEYEAKREMDSPRSVYTDLPRSMGMQKRPQSAVLGKAVAETWFYKPNPARKRSRR